MPKRGYLFLRGFSAEHGPHRVSGNQLDEHKNDERDQDDNDDSLYQPANNKSYQNEYRLFKRLQVRKN
jgi:hypothetical protein